MMPVKRIVAVCILLLPLLTGMRDPFQPVPDRCLFAEMALWRFQGMVDVDGQRVGMVRNPNGVWRRLREGDSLFGGWRIVLLNKEEITLENGAGCSPANWRWRREGTQDDKRNSSTLPLRSDDSRERKGESAPAGDADGG